MGTVFRPYTPPSRRSDRSARDRIRHRDKIKESIRDNIGDILAEESIIGQSGERVIKIPIRSIKEYRFVYGENSPGVSEGNGEQQPGDVVQKGQQEGQGQGQPGDQAGNEVFETDIHLMDLIDIMFEDLELPDLERKGLKKIMSIANKRPRGHVKTGIRARLDKRKTAKNRIKRRWATTGPRTAPKSALKDEPRFPFHRDDMRYHKAVPKEREESNAVLFCIMDTSGSMGSTKKYLARSFYFLLYHFVRQRYENVEVVFIAHHTEAKEVTEQEFFHKVESGGTYISSGYRKALDIIEDRYHPSLWNIYSFHCSDGDNFYSDNERAVEAAVELCKVSNIFGYGEIKPSGSSYYSGSMLEIFKEIKESNFQTVLIEKKEDLWPGFKAFLKSEQQEPVFSENES
jgi:sporulation protein YhbH